MRGTTPTRTPRPKSKKPSSTETRPGAYLVSPILVNDLSTQCAAHFLLWFGCHPLEQARDVLKCSVHNPGGLFEEIDYWMHQYASDAASPDNNLDYWDRAGNGPWVYHGLPAVNVAKAVKRHTRGWAPKDFAFYGFTVGEKAEAELAIASLK